MNKGVTKEKIIKAREVLRQVGITTSAYFVIGHPNETRKSIFRTIMFAAKLNPDIAAIGIMVPYPGSQIWELASRGEGGYKKISTDWTHFNKQLGNAVLMENYGRREAELFQLLGYALIYILNFRFIDLAKIAAANFKLLASIFLKIILPPNHRPAFIMFRNDGGRALKKRHMKSWG